MKKKYNQKTNALTHKITLISVLVAIGVIKRGFSILANGKNRISQRGNIIWCVSF